MLGSLRSKSFKIYFKIFLFVVGFYIRFCEILRPKADPWERTEQLPFSPQIGRNYVFLHLYHIVGSWKKTYFLSNGMGLSFRVKMKGYGRRINHSIVLYINCMAN